MKKWLKTRSAFTLAELMIVVAILGILAAIVIPEFQDHTKRAKESAAKDNLRILRQAILQYEIKHGVPPGYEDNNSSLAPNYIYVISQLTVGTDAVLSDMPENPFNGHSAFLVLSNAAVFPASPTGTDTYGWIYKPSTRTIRLNWSGTDSRGVNYFDY